MGKIGITGNNVAVRMVASAPWGLLDALPAGFAGNVSVPMGCTTTYGSGTPARVEGRVSGLSSTHPVVHTEMGRVQA